MSPYEQAVARGASYSLLGRLVDEPVTADLLPYLEQIPQLGIIDLAESGVLFHQLFRFTVFPHESLFLDASGLIGGDVVDQVVQQYRQGGFAWGDAADSLGCELRFLSFLCAAEADAWEDELPLVAGRMRGLQVEFLESHLLRWLPPIVVAVEQGKVRFYGDVIRLVWEVVCEHWGDLARTHEATKGEHEEEKFVLGDGMGVRDVVAYLVMPSRCGVWWSAADMGEIGRQLNLPRGFGGRRQTLMNLFRSAGQYDGSAALLSALLAHVDQWRQAYTDLDVLPQFVDSWEQRTEQTETVLKKMLIGVERIT